MASRFSCTPSVVAVAWRERGQLVDLLGHVGAGVADLVLRLLLVGLSTSDGDGRSQQEPRDDQTKAQHPLVRSRRLSGSVHASHGSHSIL